MATEIERKFLLKSDSWRSQVSKTILIRQGYFSTGVDGAASIRIRIESGTANLNIKSATLGITRQEFQYAIPLEDAQELLQTLCCSPLVEKNRHFIQQGKHLWEIDEFLGENSGLIVAEIELNDPDEQFEVPDWVGQEVSDDSRYYNASLVKHPFKEWDE